jgi:flagellar basal body rod protein FlgG
MVEMIEIQRAYAAVQGSMRSIDSVMETIANDIGRVG